MSVERTVTTSSILGRIAAASLALSRCSDCTMPLNGPKPLPAGVSPGQRVKLVVYGQRRT